MHASSLTHRGMNVCPICEASISHHTLCMGNLVPIIAYTCIKYFTGWQKKLAKKEDH